MVGDITYLKTASGWLYLATVIDLATRMVVGWSMAAHMRTSLIIDALTMAREHGRLHAGGAVFHSDYAEESELIRIRFNSDRGSQYTSTAFQGWCAANSVTRSMGEVGVCWDCQSGLVESSAVDSEVLVVAA